MRAKVVEQRWLEKAVGVDDSLAAAAGVGSDDFVDGGVGCTETASGPANKLTTVKATSSLFMELPFSSWCTAFAVFGILPGAQAAPLPDREGTAAITGPRITPADPEHGRTGN